MAREILLSRREFAKGKVEAVTTFPADMNTAASFLGKTAWPETSRILVRKRFVYSGDGGATWPAAGEWISYDGQILVRRGGGILTEHQATNCIAYPAHRTPPAWCDPKNPDRRFMVELDFLEPVESILAVDFKETRIDFDKLNEGLNGGKRG